LRSILKISLIALIIASGLIILLYILGINNLFGIAIIKGDGGPTTIYIAISTKIWSFVIK